jgi:hypothetical protein
MAWTQVASQPSGVTRINALAVLSAEVYGAANDGALYKWNGTNAWTQVAAPIGSYVNAKELVLYDGKLWAILCEAGQFKGKLHHFTGTAWADTAPATPTTTVGFLATAASRLFAHEGTPAAVSQTFEYVGTSTYTARSSASANPCTSFGVCSLGFAVGSAGGNIQATATIDGTGSTNYTSATIGAGASPAGAVVSLRGVGGTMYAGTGSGKLLYNSTGATGTYALQATALDAPSSITAIRSFNSKVYAGISDAGA